MRAQIWRTELHNRCFQWPKLLSRLAIVQIMRRIANAIANKCPENDASRPITPHSRCNSCSCSNDRPAVFPARLTSESGIGPACEFGSCKLQIGKSHESAPDAALKPASTPQVNNRAGRAVSASRWRPTFPHPSSPVERGPRCLAPPADTPSPAADLPSPACICSYRSTTQPSAFE